MKALLLLMFLASTTTASGQSHQEVAQSIMKNARAICSLAETPVELTLICPDNLSWESRLAFATSIANADAVLLGNTRKIKFRLKNGELFAEANPQFGIREITRSSKPTGASQNKLPKVVIGTLADTVLELRGKSVSTKQIGRDDNGLLVEWHYPDVTYLMGRKHQNGIEAYRVIKITPKP